MGFLLRLFSKNALFVFFIFLQIIALILIFSKNAMQKSWIAGQSAALNSWVSGYIGVHDTLGGGQIYTFVDGEIVFNSINRRNNYFTINRGRRDGVFPQMGVMAPKGIAGIVINATDSYALVQSVLSVNKIRINAALKNSGYFGTLTWNGDNSRVMHLADIPKYVALKVGDTVVTDGKSAIFPKGVMIGTVAGYSVDNKTGFWDISVELSEKMGALSKVYVVKNLKKAEVEKIQDTMQSVIKKEDD